MATAVDPPALSWGEISAIFGLFVILMSGLVWLIKAVSAMGRQVVTNGGSSLRDAIDRIEDNQREIKADIREVRSTLNEHNDRIYNGLGKVHARMDEHVRDHLKGEA